MSRPPLLPALGGRGGYTRRGVTQDGRLHMGGAASDKLLHRTCYTGCAVTGSDMLHRAGARGGRAAGARRARGGRAAGGFECPSTRHPLHFVVAQTALAQLLHALLLGLAIVPRVVESAERALEGAQLPTCRKGAGKCSTVGKEQSGARGGGERSVHGGGEKGAHEVCLRNRCCNPSGRRTACGGLASSFAKAERR
jgi:hypothetical protein